MSRVGKKPVEMAAGVQAAIEAHRFTVKGAKGELSMALPGGISVKQEGQQLLVECAPETKNGGAMHGVMRTLIANMVKGVSEGYEKTLQIVGVGYKAKVEGQNLVMQLGFSHPINYAIPPAVKIIVGKDNTLAVSSCDKQLVGKVSAEIRGFYPPEPYRGKGIRYKDERVKRKAGKAVATGSGS
jgi:large subunit ribosomal protein L6